MKNQTISPARLALYASFTTCALSLLTGCLGTITVETRNIDGSLANREVYHLGKGGAKEFGSQHDGNQSVYNEPAPSLEELPNAVRDGQYLAAFVPENHVGISEGLIQDQDPDAFMPEAVVTVTHDRYAPKISIKGAAEIRGKPYILHVNFKLKDESKKNKSKSPEWTLEVGDVSTSYPSAQTGRLVEDREMGRTLKNQSRQNFESTELVEVAKIARQSLKMMGIYAQMPHNPEIGPLIEKNEKGSYSTVITQATQQTVMELEKGKRANDPDSVSSRTTFSGKNVPPGLSIVLKGLKTEKNLSKVPTVEDLAMKHLANLESGKNLDSLKGLPVEDGTRIMEALVMLAVFDIHDRTNLEWQNPAETGYFLLDGRPLVDARDFFDRQPAAIACVDKKGNVNLRSINQMNPAEMRATLKSEVEYLFGAVAKARRPGNDKGFKVEPAPMYLMNDASYNQPVGTTRPVQVKTPSLKGKNL